MSTPRWVKIFAIAAGVIIVVVIAALLITGPGGHGPSRHAGSIAQLAGR